ncbi:rhomboid protease [Plasmodiophora brassicae]
MTTEQRGQRRRPRRSSRSRQEQLALGDVTGASEFTVVDYQRRPSPRLGLFPRIANSEPAQDDEGSHSTLTLPSYSSSNSSARPRGDHMEGLKDNDRANRLAQGASLAVAPPEHEQWWTQRYLTITIIAVNTVVFVATLYVANFVFEPVGTNPMIGPSSSVLDEIGAKDVPAIHNGQWYRLFTTAFVHGGIVHLLVNMYALWRVGGSMEAAFGPLPIGCIYLVAIFTSSLASAVYLPNELTVGASGAVFGIVGAMLADCAQNYKIMPPQPMYLPILLLNIVLVLAVGLIPWIDNFSHIGGLVGGFLAGLVVLTEERPAGRPLYTKILSGVALCLLVFLFIALSTTLSQGIDGNTSCPTCKYLNCIPAPFWGCPYP